ncbi:MAG TPA: GAF domain-containing protein, partial [Ignavibacteriaceae bacterium]|nr:GAF domain-containing protein [Ignavibacteriaceae bacterium]
RFDTSFSSLDNEPEIEELPGEHKQEFEESFKIISGNKPEIITAENYVPEYQVSKSALKPPDLKERFEEIANEAVPEGVGHDGQFGFVLEKMLTVIKEAYNTHTAIFFWYNKKKEKLSIEKYISVSNEIVNRKLNIEDDILSKIVQKGEPELLNDVSPAAEADAIRYYSAVQGIRSFVGVPLFYDKSLIAIIAVDSKVSDAFGIETIYSLGRFVRVITMIISIFEEKHSDSISQQRLKGLLGLIGPGSKFDNDTDLINTIHNSVGFLLGWDAFAFVYFYPVDQKFKTVKIINNTSLKYVGESLEIDLNGTLVGKSIITGIPVKIDDTSGNQYKRYSKVEDVSFDGSFLSMPLVYNNQNYGVLCFESLKKNAFSNADVQFLKNAMNILSFVIYSYSTQALLKSYLAVDVETKALNTETFKSRLEADLIKAEKVQAPGAVALIRIDDFLEQESLFDGNPLPKVLTTVAGIISDEMTSLNLFGRIGDKVFAVYFFNSNTKEVFLWAEKLRVKIARKPIAVVSKQTTYTISVGISSSTGKTNVDEVLHNADLALQKALERGGNSVKNIN